MTYVCAAGTFDRLHIGHHTLLKKVLSVVQKDDIIIIGVMSQNYIQNKALSKIIQPFEVRKQNVYDFLIQNNPLTQNIQVLVLNDPVGPILDLQKVKLIVSKETESGAIKINQMRLNFLQIQISQIKV